MTDWGELGGQSNVTGDHKGRPYGGRLGWREEEGIKTARFFAEHRNDLRRRALGVGGKGGSRTAPTGMTEGMGEGGMGPRIREDNGRGAKGMGSRICGNTGGVRLLLRWRGFGSG